MKTIKILFVLVSVCIITAHAQGYQGPAYGKVAGGITLSTDDFSIAELPQNVLPPSKGKKKSDDVNFFYSEDELNLGIFKEHRQLHKEPRTNTISLKEELNFEGPNAVGCWVPDCNITPGPVDILIAINTTFWITDRQGNLIKQIDVNNWYSDFTGDGSGLVFDPKSFYDTRTKRFYMMYLYFDRDEQTTLFMVSVSDDSTAEGNWNNWAFPADLNGDSQAEVWADFPSMIVTEDAIHMAVDMFTYSNANPIYSKLRSISIVDLQNESPGEVSYVDFWDFRNPESQNIPVRTLKLVHDYDYTNNIYLTGFRVNTLPQDNITVFEVTDIWNQPQVNAVNVETSSFRLTPHMDQKGNGYPMQLFHLFYSEMFRRHDNIYIVHSTRDGSLASIHYMEVNTDTWELDDEIIMGGDGYYYGYPDLIVDENENVFMVYQRTHAEEYPGVYYTAKTRDAETFGQDIPLIEGSGDMSALGCGSTNNYIRFCDYTDIMFDPIEDDKIWLMGEYVASDNMWKTRIAKISTDELVSIEENNLQNNFSLEQNYPNPFNPATTISFSIASQDEFGAKHAVKTTLKIYDLLGRQIATLVDSELSVGSHQVHFDAGNLPSGVYYYTLSAERYRSTKKMILLK